MKRTSLAILVVALAVMASGLALAQRGWGRRGYEEFGGDPRRGVPSWELNSEFASEAFTFVRIRYNEGGYGRGRWRGGGWRTDWPDSDLNLPYRLQQLTSISANPEPMILDLTDPKLFDYPFIYLIEPGSLMFDEAEVTALRKYCERGGFLLVDDFWGEDEWENFEFEIKRVFPNREIVDLKADHPIFHCVYNLDEPPQVPSIHQAIGGRGQGPGGSDITAERWDAEEPHYRAIHDDKGNMMVLACHNTDLGDGWEREGEDAWYFHEFAEKKSYPMAINILFYAMTH